MTFNLGVGLDDVLSPTSELFNKWKRFLQIKQESFLCEELREEEAFWGALKPYPDVEGFVSQLGRENTLDSSVSLYVFTERHPATQLVTKAWLRKYGLGEATVVFQSIKRYDCRLHRIATFIDKDPQLLSTFELEGTQAVLLDREDTLSWSGIKINSLKQGLDIKNVKMSAPWSFGSVPPTGI